MLRFLDAHRLEHSLVHYTFVYRYLFGDDAFFEKEVTKIVDAA